MPSSTTFRMVGDWSKTTQAPLQNALRTSMDVFQRSAPEACKHSLILMAQTCAKSETNVAPTNRPIMDDGDSLGPYVNTYKQGDSTPKKVHKFRFSDRLLSGDRLAGTWEKAKHIAHNKLARSSWLWDLASDGGRKMRGVTKVIKLNPQAAAGKTTGIILENRLSYLLKIMRLGWEQRCANAAVNRIMAQAARKLGIAFGSALR